ncbi:MAG TPA: hypothetical protein VGM27_24970, partial [Acidobacteriaceae bacterium]
PSHPDGGEVIATRKGVIARCGLKEAWSKDASRWIRTGYQESRGKSGARSRSAALIAFPASCRFSRFINFTSGYVAAQEEIRELAL